MLPHREERAEVSAGLFCHRGLVNPQACRRRRDPRSTDRSSTKPCGKSRSATRTYLQSVPVLTDPCGKLLHRAHSAIAQRQFPPPTEARESCLSRSLSSGCLISLRKVCVEETGDITCALCLRCNTRTAVAQPCTLPTVARVFFFGGWGLFVIPARFSLYFTFSRRVESLV